jgi:hypothetical protein
MEGLDSQQLGVAHNTGRLLELHLRVADMTERQTSAFLERLHATTLVAMKNPTGKVVVCGDMRGLNIAGPRVAEFISRVMKADNANLERSGVVIGSNAVFAMQVDRLVREAGHPNRRRFDSAEGVTAWLAEILTPAETERLKVFLASYKGPGAT